MKNQILVVGQKIHCTLYGGKDGYITHITGEQKPETCKSILGNVGVTGGNAEIHIVFEDHFSSVPESLVRQSVQWAILKTVISETELENRIATAYACLQEKKEQHEKEQAEKEVEKERQREADEYAHLTPCDKYDTTATAKNIRAHLKKLYPGVKFSVRKEYHSSIAVTWTDGVFSSVVQESLSKFKLVTGYDMGDSAIYAKHAWIFGIVDYLSIRRDHSDEALQDAINKVNAEYRNNATLEQYKQGKLPILCTNADWNSYYRELCDVLEGRKDYELQNKQFYRSESVTKELINVYGFKTDRTKGDSRVFVMMNNSQWIVTKLGYCEHDFRFTDDFSLSDQELAAMLNEKYDEIALLVQQDDEKQAEIEKRNAQEIIPVSVSYESKFLKVTFPSCNKNHQMDENDEEILDKPDPANCEVKKTIVLNNEFYELVSNSLLNDRNYLWEKIGGSGIEDEHLAGIVTGSPEYYEAWQIHGITNVTEVINQDTQDRFYVDTSGHQYARYVGRDDEWMAKIETNKIIANLTAAIA